MLELQGRSAKNKISNNSNNQNGQLGKTVQRRIGGQRVATWNILYYKVQSQTPREDKSVPAMIRIQ